MNKSKKEILTKICYPNDLWKICDKNTMMEILCIFSEIEKQVNDGFVIHVESKLSKDEDILLFN